MDFSKEGEDVNYSTWSVYGHKFPVSLWSTTEISEPSDL